MKSAYGRRVCLFSVALLLIAACGLAARQTAWADCSQQKIFEMIVEDRSTAQISRECGDPQARRPSVFNFVEKGGEWVKAVTPAPGNGGGFLLVGGAWIKGSEAADGWVIRLDWKGNKLWERTFAGIGENFAAYVLSAPDGGYILAGNDETAFEVTANAWVIRLDRLGNTLWKRTYGGKYYDVASAITAVPSGGYLLAGYTNSKGAGYSDGWAVRLDEKGNTLWERTFGGRREDKAFAVIPADGNGGGFLLVGRTSSRGAGKSDAWAIRLDDEGNKIWERAVGGSEWDVAYGVVRVPGGTEEVHCVFRKSPRARRDLVARKYLAFNLTDRHRIVRCDRAKQLRPVVQGLRTRIRCRSTDRRSAVGGAVLPTTERLYL